MVPYVLGEVLDGKTGRYLSTRMDQRGAEGVGLSRNTTRQDICAVLQAEAFRLGGIQIEYEADVVEYVGQRHRQASSW